MRPHLRRLRPKALRSSPSPALVLRNVPVLPLAPPSALSAPVIVQSRSLFGLPNFFQSKKAASEPEAPPGLLVLKSVVSHLDTKVGSLPSLQQTIQAYCDFVNYLSGATASKDRIALLRRVYEYLREVQPGQLPLPRKTLSTALRSFGGGLPDHIELARMMFADLTSVEGYKPNLRDIKPFLVALSAGGEVTEVLEICRALTNIPLEGREGGLWELGMAAAAKTGDEKLLLRTLREAIASDSVSRKAKGRIYDFMIVFYCDRGELEKAREWYDRAVEEGSVPPSRSMVTILKACIRDGRLEWGDEMLNTLMTKIISPQEDPELNKEAWDAALAFTVSMGKGVPGVTQLLSEMEAFVAANPTACPPIDITTINSILRSAVLTNDVSVIFYLNDYLASHLEIEQDLETYDLRMEAALNTPDLPLAVSLFEDLKFNIKVPRSYRAEQPQRLLAALIAEPNPPLPRIMDIYSDIREWGVRFNSNTVLHMLAAHLSSSDFPTIRTFIKAHIGYLSAEDREAVLSTLIRFSFHPNTPVGASWEIYRIMAKVMPELSVQHRHDFIDLFCNKAEEKWALRVLTHMSLTPDRAPTKETYTKLFLHLARAQDGTAIQTANRILNMDANIEPDTRLFNYLLLAFSRCSLYARAWFVYEEITRSQEGPDHATLSIVWGELCKRDTQDGLRMARNIWDRCKRHKVDLVDRNIANWVESMCWHEQWEEAFQAVKKAEEDGWLKIGPRT